MLLTSARLPLVLFSSLNLVTNCLAGSVDQLDALSLRQRAPSFQTLSQLLLSYSEASLPITGTADSLFYYTSTLALANSKPTLLILCIFGLRHDLGECFAQNKDIVSRANAVVVAPYFGCKSAQNAVRQTCLSGELCWATCNGFAGNEFPLTGTDSPFTITDNVVLATRKQYPSIKNVVVVGFSLGAQFVNHYAAVTILPDSIPMRFVFASASGYLYLDTKRPTASGSFKNYNPKNCLGFNDWKYGLDYYPGLESPQVIASRLLSRNLTIVALKYDNGCGGGFTCSCEVLAQSSGDANRYILGQTYYTYLSQSQGKSSGLFYAEIKTCGHNTCCFYNDVDVQTVLFGAAVVFPVSTGSNMPVATSSNPSLPSKSSFFSLRHSGFLLGAVSLVLSLL
ncbi:hypothetical protein BDR26DRAFT_869593, partial [Obelidium mucronatum]